MLPNVWLLPAIRNLAISTHGSWLVQVHCDDGDEEEEDEGESGDENIGYNVDNVNVEDDNDDDVGENDYDVGHDDDDDI